MSSQNAESERVSNRRKVLGANSGDLTWNGIPAPLLIGAAFAALFVGIADHVLDAAVRWPAYLLGLFAVVFSYVAMKHAPNHLPAHEHVRRWITHRVRQHTMLNARNESTTAQPVNDGVLGWLMSRPMVEHIRFFDRQGDSRAQDAVQVRRPFHNTPAIETTDGGVVGAIKVRPAAMAVADKGHWERRVRRLANAIDSSVTTRVEFTSKMRAVDYTDRIATYDIREQQLLHKLTTKHGSIDTAYKRARAGDIDEEDLGLLVAADLAAERQNVIDMYDVTTLTREYYVIVRIDPSDVVTDISADVGDGGGIQNVPYLSKLWEWRRLQQIREEGDHTKVLIDRLENKLETLQRDLGTIEDISTHTLSSTEYSQVLADHYQATNIYANTGFKDLVRLSPQPNSSDGMAMYGVTHDYIRDLPSERIGTTETDDTPSSSRVAPDTVNGPSALGQTPTGTAETAGMSERLSVPDRPDTRDSEQTADAPGVAQRAKQYLSEFAVVQ